jgi:hypothetical protein
VGLYQQFYFSVDLEVPFKVRVHFMYNYIDYRCFVGTTLLSEEADFDGVEAQLYITSC